MVLQTIMLIRRILDFANTCPDVNVQIPGPFQAGKVKLLHSSQQNEEIQSLNQNSSEYVQLVRLA